MKTYTVLVTVGRGSYDFAGADELQKFIGSKLGERDGKATICVTAFEGDRIGIHAVSHSSDILTERRTQTLHKALRDRSEP